MRYRVDNVARAGGGNPEAFLRSVHKVAPKRRVSAPLSVDSYSICSHALKAYKYTPAQGNVFAFILGVCEKVRKDYNAV